MVDISKTVDERAFISYLNGDELLKINNWVKEMGFSMYPTITPRGNCVVCISSSKISEQEKIHIEEMLSSDKEGVQYEILKYQYVHIPEAKKIFL